MLKSLAGKGKGSTFATAKAKQTGVVKLWRDAGGRRTGADAGFLKKKLEKKVREKFGG